MSESPSPAPLPEASSEDRPSFDPFRRALFLTTPRVWATPMLVGLNALVFLAMVASGVSFTSPTTQSLLQWGADFGPKTIHGEWWRMFTNTFVHIGIVHVAMNMYGLWQIGFLVERLLGNFRFLTTYLLSGLAGSLASLWMHPFSVAAGASGAVFGIYGALLGYLTRERGTVPKAILQSLLKTTLSFVGMNAVLGLQMNGIDMAAHGGGLLGGAVCAYVIARPLDFSRQRPSQRWVPLIVFASGLGVLGALSSLLHPVVDLAAEFAAFAEVEGRVVDRFNVVRNQAQNQTLTNAELADAMERDVLPAWRDLQAHWDSLSPRAVPPQLRPNLEKLTTYLHAREQGWSALVVGLRNNDAEAIRAATQAIAQAAEDVNGAPSHPQQGR